MPSSSEIRQQFIDFFVQKHGHTFVPSSSVVPLDDPTLLFTNAGMNQFKDVFLGTGSRPYKRAANTQKCIRAGGKHNDLDDVGKDTYHHTFFEMLGNWSFGDYFKREAIQWAWELLTQVWKLDKSRLHATVFEGAPDEGVPRDDEAIEYWKTLTDINHQNIHLGNKKDNFWEMGETGPCGPCTEIHIDLTPDGSGAKLVNKGTPQVIEIWNLVFIQFNRGSDKKLTPLPAKHVDTGMGFERVTAVLQGKTSNYDTDVFSPIFKSIQDLTGAPPYTGKLEDLRDTAYRVIADHIRTLTFALTDGARMGNEGRDYVLRRILRRAARYGMQFLNTKGPFLCDLVSSVVSTMSDFFSELKNNPSTIVHQIREEEISFNRNLEQGIRHFRYAVARTVGPILAKLKGDTFLGYEIRSRTEDPEAKTLGIAPELSLSFAISGRQILLPTEAEQLKGFIQREINVPIIISGEEAFKLHDTYGVYIDIVEQMASEIGIGVNRSEYERLREEDKERTREKRKKNNITAVEGDILPTDDSPKYGPPILKAKVIGWVKQNLVGNTGQFNCGDEIALLLDKTNFYAEQGGQVGDVGWIKSETGSFEVQDTQRLGDGVLHIGRVHEGAIKVNQKVTLEVGEPRSHTMRNHTTTHLLNWALRKVLGPHIDQKGSLVDPEKTRFDFAHDSPLKPEEIAEVERLVNEKIYGDLPVTASVMSLADAKKIKGVRAVFGEKYPDPVRVLMIGPKSPDEATPEDSIEFCGGTHLHRTGEAGFFKIVSQELVAKGVRRVTAVTGKGAVQAVQQMASVLDQLASKFNCRPEEVASRIESLQEENKKLQQQVKKGVTGDLRTTADKLFTEAVEVNGVKIITGIMPPAASDLMLQELDRMRQKAGSAIILVGWSEEDKVSLLAGVTDDIVKKGGHAGNLIKAVAPLIGGKGGGKPNMAQGGGKDASKLPEAMAEARKVAAAQLGGS